MFFIAAALVLTTAGVFAGKAKFAIQGLYAINGATTVRLSTSYDATNLTTTASGTQVVARNSANVAYNVFTFNTTTSTYVPLYSQGSW